MYDSNLECAKERVINELFDKNRNRVCTSVPDLDLKSGGALSKTRYNAPVHLCALIGRNKSHVVNTGRQNKPVELQRLDFSPFIAIFTRKEWPFRARLRINGLFSRQISI
jgi:hypothetical protein